MSSPVETKRQISRLALNFILLGGGIAWVLHLFLTYAISEFGCVSGGPDFWFLGVHGIAWLLLAASAVPIALSIASVLVARRVYQNLRKDRKEGEDISGPEIHMVYVGVIVNVLFVVIILAQTVPIFFYLQGCQGGA